MFKFMRQVGLALCVGMAVAVGLAAGGYCVARFDAKSLLKGALAALEPAQPAKPAVEVAAVDEAVAASDAEPSQAKRRKRSPVLRPVVLEEEAGEESNEAAVEEFPRLAALPLPVRELTAAALGAQAPTLDQVTTGGYTWEGKHVLAKSPAFVPGSDVTFALTNPGNVPMKFNGQDYKSGGSGVSVNGSNVLQWTNAGSDVDILSYRYVASSATAIPKTVAANRFGAASAVGGAITVRNGFSRFEIATDERAVVTAMIFKEVPASGGTSLWQYVGDAPTTVLAAKGGTYSKWRWRISPHQRVSSTSWRFAQSCLGGLPSLPLHRPPATRPKTRPQAHRWRSRSRPERASPSTTDQPI